jgi:F0F1-type ATP synthase membrane subunit b/b'
MSTCTYCLKNFHSTSTLNRHLKTCKKKISTEFEEYNKTQLQNLREQYENQIQNLREQYENQIQNLREQLEEFKTQIFEIAKQPKEQHTIHNTTKTITHNEKINILNQLAPMDFEQSQEEIEKIIKTHFTEEVFLGGPSAIAQMIVRHILQDPESNKYRLLCADSSRKHFKYVDSKTGEVQIDYRFQRFYDLLKTPSDKANFLACYLSLEKNDYKNDKYFRDIRDRNSDFIQSRHLLSDRIISEITKT